MLRIYLLIYRGELVYGKWEARLTCPAYRILDPGHPWFSLRIQHISQQRARRCPNTNPERWRVNRRTWRHPRAISPFRTAINRQHHYRPRTSTRTLIPHFTRLSRWSAVKEHRCPLPPYIRVTSCRLGRLPSRNSFETTLSSASRHGRNLQSG